MMRSAFALVAFLAAMSAFAGNDVLCSGEKQLARAEGLWVLHSFTKALVQSRSWAASLEKIDSSAASLRIGNDGIYFNLSWHEGDSPDGNCVRLKSGKLWARRGWNTGEWFGPYVRVGPASANEATYYLGKYFSGCFDSDAHERWCLSPTKISVGGKELPAEFQMDIIEGPHYGTGFRVNRKRLPFLVFVPRTNGWAVYEDDWASSEDRVPVDPAKDKPWRRLKR